MKYTIECAELNSDEAASSSYESLEQAREALRRGLGWPDLYLGPGYTTADSSNQIWCAFRTRIEGDANVDDARTPRITRVAEAS